MRLFHTLSNAKSEAKRSAAIRQICEDLVEKPDGIAYTLQRLLRGLASPSGFARQGFASALTVIVERFSENIETDNLVNLIEKHVCLEDGAGRQDRKQYLIAKVFALMVLVRSHRIVHIQQEKLAEFVVELVKHSEKYGQMPANSIAITTLTITISFTSLFTEAGQVSSVLKLSSFCWML